MALIWEDTADYYTLIGQTTSSANWASFGTTTLVSSVGPFGGNALSNVGTTGSTLVSKTFNYSISNTIPLNFGFWIKSHESSTGSVQAYALRLNTNQGNWNILAPAFGANSLIVNNQLNGSGTTAGSAPVGNGVYHFVQLSVLFSTTSSGYVKVYVDGILDINYTGAATVSGTLPTTLTNFNFWPGTINNSSDTAYSSGFYFWDSTGSAFNTFPLPSLRTSVLSPTSNGDTNQYTPSTGSNFSCVNGGFADATFVSNASTGQLDLYHFGALPYVPQIVYAVVGNYYGENSGGTGTSNLIPNIKTSSTSATGATQVLPISTLTNLKNNFYTDAGGSAWTSSSVNAMQLGMGD